MEITKTDAIKVHLTIFFSGLSPIATEKFVSQTLNICNISVMAKWKNVCFCPIYKNYFYTFLLITNIRELFPLNQ